MREEDADEVCGDPWRGQLKDREDEKKDVICVDFYVIQVNDFCTWGVEYSLQVQLYLFAEFSCENQSQAITSLCESVSAQMVMMEMNQMD